MKYSENGFYIFGAFVSAVALAAVLFLVPANPTITQVIIWGVIPLVGFVIFNQLIASRAHYPTVLYALGLLALFLRLALGIYMYTHVLEGNGFGNVFVKDDYYFFSQGTRVAESWQGVRTLPSLQRTTEIGPIYFNALIVYVLGPDPRNVMAVQSIFGALSVVLTFFVARYFISERKSLLASLILAIYPLQIYLAASNRRDNLIVFLTLAIVLLLLRMKSQKQSVARNPSSFVLLLVVFMMLLAIWRVYNAIMLSFVILGWFLISSSRARIGKSLIWLLVPILGIGLLLYMGVISVERLDLSQVLLGEEQLGRFDQIEEAQTFGFLSAARGLYRIPYLVVTLPLALVFGFNKFNPNHPDFNILSLGYLWLWIPLLLPMLLGTIEIFRQSWRKYYYLWAVPIGILTMSAVGYLGLIARYRAAAEPFLIVLAMIGLASLQRLLGLYLIGVLTFAATFNILFWSSESSIPLLLGTGAALMMVMVFIVVESVNDRVSNAP